MDTKQAFREIMDSIRHGATEQAWALLGTDAGVRSMVTPFGSWLHVAASHGNLALVRRLVESGADVNHRSGILGGAPINLAASEGHVHVVEYLLSIGAKLDVTDPQRNPLFAAIYGGHLAVVRLLIESGLDSSLKYSGEHMKDMDALAFARERGQSDIVAYLLEL